MKEDFLTYGVTGFIDILGFGAKVLNAVEKSHLDEIIDAVNSVREHFDHNPKDTTKKEVQELAQITTLAFSDSVIINIPLTSKFTDLTNEFDNIMHEVTSLAYAQASCIFDGFFIRGGVDLGWWYKEEDILISQSLTRAYLTESTANYPVILITNEFRKYFEEHEGKKYYSYDAFLSNFIPVQLTQKDGTAKEFLFLDYIGISLGSLGYMNSQTQKELKALPKGADKDLIITNGFKQNIDDWLMAHANKIKTAFHLAQDERVQDKYSWLSDYHNQKASEFSSNPNCQCNLTKDFP